jgi:hypothetical protein
VDEAGYIMVRRNQQCRRIGEGQVLFNNACVHVSVRRDDGEAGYEVVEGTGYVPYAGFHGEEPVGLGCK